VEATANQIKFDISVDVLVEAQGFDVQQPDVVVGERHSQEIFSRAYTQPEDLNPFGGGRTPLSDKIEGLLSRG
jgi:hypothetical protein